MNILQWLYKKAKHYRISIQNEKIALYLKLLKLSYLNVDDDCEDEVDIFVPYEDEFDEFGSAMPRTLTKEDHQYLKYHGMKGN